MEDARADGVRDAPMDVDTNQAGAAEMEANDAAVAASWADAHPGVGCFLVLLKDNRSLSKE